MIQAVVGNNLRGKTRGREWFLERSTTKNAGRKARKSIEPESGQKEAKNCGCARPHPRYALRARSARDQCGGINERSSGSPKLRLRYPDC